MPEDNINHIDFDALNSKAISQPVVKHIYTADPTKIKCFEECIY